MKNSIYDNCSSRDYSIVKRDSHIEVVVKDDKTNPAPKPSVQDLCDPNHYKGGKTEVIDILEEVIENPKRRLTQKQRYNIAQALKYLLRCGLKGDRDTVVVDLQKAENYIHRAMTGSWIDRSSLDGRGKSR